MKNVRTGDRVKFKSLEQMKEEGVDLVCLNDDHLKSLENVCATVTAISAEGGIIYIELDDFSNGLSETGFYYNVDMVDVIDEPQYIFNVGCGITIEFDRDADVKKIGQNEFVAESLLTGKKYGITILTNEINEPRWTFTDDEKVILRNLPEEYKWIARDKDGKVKVNESKYNKKDDDMWLSGIDSLYLYAFNHLFQSIKWTDTEPCEFRKYL